MIKATAAACSRDWLTHQPKPSPMKRMKPSIILIEPRNQTGRGGRALCRSDTVLYPIWLKFIGRQFI